MVNLREARLARAGFARPRFRVGATAEQINRKNDLEPIALDNEMRQYAADIAIMPLAGVELFASGSRFDVDHVIGLRRPETFVIDRSVYLEEGTGYEGGVNFFRGPFMFNVSGSRFDPSASAAMSSQVQRRGLTM